MCTSTVVALFMLHKALGDGEAGKTLHILRLNSHFLVAEPEAQRGGWVTDWSIQKASAGTQS